MVRLLGKFVVVASLLTSPAFANEGEKAEAAKTEEAPAEEAPAAEAPAAKIECKGHEKGKHSKACKAEMKKKKKAEHK